MPVGAKVWDAAGNVVFDEITRLARVLGQVDAGLSGGSLSNAGFATGEPFAVVLNTGPSYEFATLPIVTFSGTTMNWTSCNAPTLIIYGVR